MISGWCCPRGQNNSHQWPIGSKKSLQISKGQSEFVIRQTGHWIGTKRQNTTQKRLRNANTSKTGFGFVCPGRACISCSTSGTRCVTLVNHPVLNMFYSHVETLEWPYHFTKRGGLVQYNLLNPLHFLLKCLYQAREVSGHENVCLEYWFCICSYDFSIGFCIVPTVWCVVAFISLGNIGMLWSK